MCLLSTCCGMFTLRTGSLVTGILSILMAIISLVMVFFVNVEYKTIVLDWLPTWIVKIILAINLAMTILISILLMVGVVKQNTFLMLPWVLLGILLAIGLLVSIIYTGVEFILQDHVNYGIIWLVLGIITVIIYVYMWLVVYSYFHTVRETRGRYMKAPYRR